MKNPKWKREKRKKEILLNQFRSRGGAHRTVLLIELEMSIKIQHLKKPKPLLIINRLDSDRIGGLFRNELGWFSGPSRWTSSKPSPFTNQFENINPIPTHTSNQSEPWITKPNSCWVKGSCLEMPVTKARKQILPSISLYTGNKALLIKTLHLIEFIGMILYSDLLHENPNDQDKQTSSSDCNMKCNLPYRDSINLLHGNWKPLDKKIWCYWGGRHIWRLQARKY